MFIQLLADYLLLHFHDPCNHTNEGPIWGWEAHGVVTSDDRAP